MIQYKITVVIQNNSNHQTESMQRIEQGIANVIGDNESKIVYYKVNSD